MHLTGLFKVKAVKKKTSAVFFKELKVGDVIELRYSLSGSYGYAPTVYIYKDGKRQHNNSALQLSKNLDNFELEQVS